MLHFGNTVPRTSYTPAMDIQSSRRNVPGMRHKGLADTLRPFIRTRVGSLDVAREEHTGSSQRTRHNAADIPPVENASGHLFRKRPDADLRLPGVSLFPRGKRSSPRGKEPGCRLRFHRGLAMGFSPRGGGVRSERHAAMWILTSLIAACASAGVR